MPNDMPIKGTVFLATGGTGGHVFPAEALAWQLMQNGYQPIAITDRRTQSFGKDLSPAISHIKISGRGVMGKGILAIIKALLSLGIGYGEALFHLFKHRPALVVGFGGYSSLPTLLAAQHFGFATMIHEQNAVMGRANVLLSKKAKAIALSFHNTEKISHAAQKRAVVTGNPVRRAIAALKEKGTPYPKRKKSDPFYLLVVGGSQGARIFSRLLPEALGLIPPEIREKINIVQQARKEDCAALQKHYKKLGMTPVISHFFSDLPDHLVKAHLLISRAGASTTSEMIALGRPSILIPYPYAIDDHQSANAARISDGGGAWLRAEKDLDHYWLADRLSQFIESPALLETHAKAAAKMGKQDAAKNLCDLAINFIRKKA